MAADDAAGGTEQRREPLPVGVAPLLVELAAVAVVAVRKMPLPGQSLIELRELATETYGDAQLGSLVVGSGPHGPVDVHFEIARTTPTTRGKRVVDANRHRLPDVGTYIEITLHIDIATEGQAREQEYYEKLVSRLDGARKKKNLDPITVKVLYAADQARTGNIRTLLSALSRPEK